jgi:hypothetical protein
MAFLSKTNVMIKVVHNLALFWVKKRHFFCWIFRRKYLKNHNIGPWFSSPKIPIAVSEGLDKSQVSALQSVLGVATSLGSLSFGFVAMSKSAQCTVSRQFLVQASLLGIGKFAVVAFCLIFLAFIFLKYSQCQWILRYDNSTEMYKLLKKLTP